MFKDTELVYIFAPSLVLATIIAVLLAIRSSKKANTEWEKAIALFKNNLIVFGALVVVLYLSLPSTPSLSTFGYPADLSVIQDDKKLLHLLQTYNKALVRTTEVVHWFLFIFIWFFLVLLINFTTAFKNSDTNSVNE
jgi:hypothetical protein